MIRGHAGPRWQQTCGAGARRPTHLQQVFFRFVQQLGVVPLTGTTSPEHMAEDLDVLQRPFSLTEAEMAAIDAELLASASAPGARQ